MKIVRIYTDKDGKSKFGEAPGLLPEAGGGGPLIPAKTVQFMRVIPHTSGFPDDWHPAPKRQFVVLLSGEMELEIESGEKRILNAGDILLAEDLTGKGHLTRRRGDCRYFLAAIEEQALR